MEDDDDDEFPAVAADQFGADAAADVTSYCRRPPRRTDPDGCGSEVARLANTTRECAIFMADFVQKIFDPS